MIGWHLNGNLSAGSKLVVEIGNQFPVILTPLQSSIAEDQIPFACQLRLVALFKLQVGPEEERDFSNICAEESRPVHAAVGKFLRQLTRQFARPASEVDNCKIGAHFDQRQQIKEGCGAFALKLMILIRIQGTASPCYCEEALVNKAGRSAQPVSPPRRRSNLL